MTLGLKKKQKKLLKWWRKNVPTAVTYVLVLGFASLAYAGYASTRRTPVDPTAYTPLLNLIAQAESSDNYNAYFGSPENTAIDFTAMSIAEVMAWQKDFVKQGQPSSAVGRYQIISPTLSGLVRQLDIDTRQKFDKATQDRMAVALLERRGAVKYVNKEITREEFAANLAKEWAALPKVVGDNPHESYYAADGINQSRVAVPAILATIARVHS